MVPERVEMARSTHHAQVDVGRVLKRIQEADKPGRLCGREDIPLDEDVPDLVHLCEGALAHLLERDNFLRVLLSREEDLAVPALPDLDNDVEGVEAELCPALAEEGALAPRVGRPVALEGLARELAVGASRVSLLFRRSGYVCP